MTQIIDGWGNTLNREWLEIQRKETCSFKLVAEWKLTSMRKSAHGKTLVGGFCWGRWLKNSWDPLYHLSEYNGVASAVSAVLYRQRSTTSLPLSTCTGTCKCSICNDATSVPATNQHIPNIPIYFLCLCQFLLLLLLLFFSFLFVFLFYSFLFFFFVSLISISFFSQDWITFNSKTEVKCR